MFICADIPPLAQTQSTQRNGLGGGGTAAAQNRMRMARNHGYDTTATNRFFYGAQNKLVRIEGRGFTNEFLYDSQNRRIGVKLSATWRYDAHDGNLCISSVVNGVLDRFFMRGVGIAEGTGDIIAEIPDPRNPSPHPYYYISNHRGDTLVVLNDVYNTAARYEYDAFGNVIEKTGTYTPRYTFSTKENLSSAALYLYQYRGYDPIAGRWTQRDPIDYQDSVNLYQFCGNNGVNLTDPHGRQNYLTQTDPEYAYNWALTDREWRFGGNEVNRRMALMVGGTVTVAAGAGVVLVYGPPQLQV